MADVTHSTPADATFSDAGQQAWDASHTIDPTLSTNAVTTTAYTIQSTDNGKLVTLNNGSAVTVTVSTGLGYGFNCLLMQLGAGAVSTLASGTTINSNGALQSLGGQYAVATLIAYAADTFVLAGDLA